MGASIPTQKSYPGGAKAYLDGDTIGTTPVETEIPRSQVDLPHTWRVEFRNCDVAEGNLEKHVAGGRVTGYLFTLGILAIFRGPRGVMIQNIVGDKNQATTGSGFDVSKTQRLAERLTTLRDLYNRKLISQSVDEQESQKAIRDIGDH
jgi:hypothetical protein